MTMHHAVGGHHMQLPPVDVYRAPFVEPIGHLAMQAAYADKELFELVSESSQGSEDLKVSSDEAAHCLRIWDDKAKAFAAARVDLITDLHQRNAAHEALNRYGRLKEQRHRTIHDSVEVGIFGTDETGYFTKPLHLEHRKVGRRTESWLHKITPEQIAALACEVYELQKDLGAITYALRSQPTSLSTARP